MENQDDLDNASSSSNDEGVQSQNERDTDSEVDKESDNDLEEEEDLPPLPATPAGVELLNDVNPSTQPPGTYLVPKHVSYGTMLAQGQLYFRSWQELQVTITSLLVCQKQFYYDQLTISYLTKPARVTKGMPAQRPKKWAGWP